MEKYRHFLTSELLTCLIPAAFIAVVLIAALCIAPKFLLFIEMENSKRGVFSIIILLFLLNVVWTCSDAVPLFLDLRENSFVEYTGEVEYLREKGSKETDIFQLNDLPEPIAVEVNVGSVEATIQRCQARVIYTEHSKLILEFEVLEILERGSAIVVR